MGQTQTIAITGASSGIGAAAAVRLARPGRHLVLLARRQPELNQVAEAVRRSGATARVVPLDLRRDDAVDRVASALATDDLPDVLVLNAGRSSSLGVTALPDRLDVLCSTAYVNYLGQVRLALGLLPAMLAAGRGHIVGVTSANARVPAPGWSTYSASKAAFDAWLRAIRPELATHGITTTIVAFPLVRTPMIEPVYGSPRWAMSVDRAAGWIERAVERRPAEIRPWWLRPAEVLVAAAPHISASLVGRVSQR